MKRVLAVCGCIPILVLLVWLAGSPGLPARAQPPPDAAPTVVTPNPEGPTSPAPASVSYQLLTNPGVEVYDASYAQFEGINCQVASGWQRFWDEDLPEPCWMDCRVFADSHLGGGWVDRIEGETSQLLVGTEPYLAGIRQTVSGLVPGRGYGFHAAMLSIYQTSAPPDVDNTMFKQVGLDPTGGTDPDAPSVVWCEPDGHDANGWSVDLRAAAFAQSSTMTVFIRVDSPLPAGDLPYINLGFLDSAILALTPVVTATSPAVSEVPTFTVSWDNAQAAPGVKKLKDRNVQWLDEAEGVWHDWLTTTEVHQATFVGQYGHTYRFRARVWQKYENGALLYSPYRPEGDTRTYVLGPRLSGQVWTAEGQPLAGATVAISGTAYATTSGSWGRYELEVPAMPDPQAVIVSHPHWLSPPPVYGLTWGPTETVSLTWTLRPPDDVVANGQFEAGLGGWSPSGPEPTPAVVSEPVHSGHYALALGGTAGVSQTVILTNAWEPALSFWYRAAAADADDLTLTVVLTVVTQTITSTVPLTTTPPITTAAPVTTTPPVTPPLPISITVPVTTTYVFTPSLAGEGWQHQWYPVGRPQAYLTATVTLQFRVWSDDDQPAAVYLDEVSLGATPGGPHRVYLPLVTKKHVPLTSSIPAFRPNMVE